MDRVQKYGCQKKKKNVQCNTLIRSTNKIKLDDRNVIKRTFGHVRLAKIQMSLSLIRIFTLRSLDREGYKSFLRRTTDQTSAQADSSLRLAHMTEGTFSHSAAQILNV